MQFQVFPLSRNRREGSLYRYAKKIYKVSYRNGRHARAALKSLDESDRDRGRLPTGGGLLPCAAAGQSLACARGGVFIPGDARFEDEYVGGAAGNELLIRAIWYRRVGVPEFIHQHPDLVKDSHGHTYETFICGSPRADGTWEGLIEFVPVNESLPARRTSRETTQPNRGDLAYGATGLEPIYIGGAFDRAT